LARQVDEFDRLARLINQILTLARAEAGEIPIAHEPVDLSALGSVIAEQIEPVAAARDVTLTCNLSSGRGGQRRRGLAGAPAAHPAGQRHQVHAGGGRVT
jgi:signal transduction histidine kinase